MVKGSWSPAWIGRMTGRAIRGEFRCYMVRIFRGLVRGIVTAITIFRGIFKDTAFVAKGAVRCDAGMRPGQWIYVVMVKCTRSPTWICRVTGSTICRKSRRRVIRILSSLIGGIVTGVTVSWRGFYIPCFVTCGTIRSHGRMGTCERIDGIVIKVTGSPAWICTVTCGTIFRESGQCMVGIFCTLEICGVTGGAVGRRGFYIPSFMAGGTIICHGCMCTGERID